MMQELEDKLLLVSGLTPNHLPTEVACLSHLERCVEVAGSSIIVVAFYSRVSLVCKVCFGGHYKSGSF